MRAFCLILSFRLFNPCYTYRMLIGVDEVGRGCWAGPVVAGAVMFGRRYLPGIKDSKRLTRDQREELDRQIRSIAIAVGVGWALPEEVDELGLTRATGLAMQRAVAEITKSYKEIVIDGNLNHLKDNPKARTMVKADGILACVGAASIVAKVARDNFMVEVSKDLPGYAFERHVGYGTPEHQQALAKLGVSKIHRRRFKPIAEFL
jgi:ribonuclease HII